jgi:hypothetical protein
MGYKEGIVKYAADREFPDKYNPGRYKQSLTMTMSDGTEEQLWFTSGRIPHSKLKRGEKAGILYEQRPDGKTIRKLVTNEGNSPGEQAAQNARQPKQDYSKGKPRLSDQEKKQWVADTVAAYGEVFVAVENYFRQELGYKLSEESVRTIATSICIQFDRKYPNENLKLTEVEMEQSSPTQNFQTASEQVAAQPIPESVKQNAAADYQDDFDFDGEF